MAEVKKFTALWDEPSVMIVALMHAPKGQEGRYTVMHWCRKDGEKLEVEKLKDEPVPTDEEAMTWAHQFADEKNIEVIYVCNFDDED